MLTDDQGYADVGCYGAQGFATPRLDRMAAEGLRFTDFHVSQAVCSASRASLMTGCYAERVGIEGALNPNSRIGLHPDEETIAELLREAGYATGIFGKWHLGHHEPFLPLQQGFDEYAGLPYSNDMWPFEPGADPLEEITRNVLYPELRFYEGNEPAEVVGTLADQAALTEQITRRALDFIGRQAEHDEQPFFLYVAHSMPHVPLGDPLSFAGRSEQGAYGDVIMEIDDSIGRILDALDESGVGDDTLVIFTSDNGPWLRCGDHAGSAGPLREGKMTVWEGGTRVPCIARWPGRIAAGGTCDRLATTMDLLPTITALAGARSPTRRIDGVSLASLLDEPTGESPRRALCYYYGGHLNAVRRDRWKLVFPHEYGSYDPDEPGRGGVPGPYVRASCGLELYDLDEDPGETADVSSRHPDVVRELQLLARQARDVLGDRHPRRAGESGPSPRPASSAAAFPGGASRSAADRRAGQRAEREVRRGGRVDPGRRRPSGRRSSPTAAGWATKASTSRRSSTSEASPRSGASPAASSGHSTPGSSCRAASSWPCLRMAKTTRWWRRSRPRWVPIRMSSPGPTPPTSTRGRRATFASERRRSASAPSGTPAAGEKCWTFVDEIVVE